MGREENRGEERSREDQEGEEKRGTEWSKEEQRGEEQRGTERGRAVPQTSRHHESKKVMLLPCSILSSVFFSLLFFLFIHPLKVEKASLSELFVIRLRRKWRRKKEKCHPPDSLRMR